MAAPGSAAPAVSVVTAAYNAEAFLRDTIESVLAQSFPDFEHVVVDDGSTDGTPDLVASYGPPVRLVRQANGGPANARNTGIRAARGRFVAFLDHDDLATPDRLACTMEVVARHPDAAWVYGDAVYFDHTTGKEMHRASAFAPLREGDVLAPLLLGNFIPFSTAAVRRDVFDRVGFFDERRARVHIDDWDLWVRVAPHYAAHVVRAPLLRYRWHGTQATQRMDLDEALANRLDLIHTAAAQHPERLARRLPAAEAAAYLAIGRLWLSRGEAARARGCFVQSVRRHPLDVHAWTFLGGASIPRGLRRALGRLRRKA